MLHLLILALLTAALAAAQAALDDSNMACVHSLAMPRYPVIASSSRTTGELKASVVVSSSGRAADIKWEGKAMFSSAVQNALEAATFSDQCAGKTVTLIFRFQLEGVAPDDRPPQQKLIFSYPNVFLIVSEARHWVPSH